MKRIAEEIPNEALIRDAKKHQVEAKRQITAGIVKEYSR
jgi:hypothetical protein